MRLRVMTAWYLFLERMSQRWLRLRGVPGIDFGGDHEMLRYLRGRDLCHARHPDRPARLGPCNTCYAELSGDH